MKKVGLVLIVLGSALLAYTVLHSLGYLSLVDTTPPEFIYVFPTDDMTYKPAHINEYVAYVKDTETDITYVSYSDRHITVQLILTPYTEIEHTLDLGQYRFPDANLDGAVDDYEMDGVQQYYNPPPGTTDVPYDPSFDFNDDGIIDSHDFGVVTKYYGTRTFRAEAIEYNTGIVDFVFEAVNEHGLYADYQGSFTVENYELLAGKWYINDQLIEGDSIAIDFTSTISVKFVKEDYSISDSDITVEVIADKVYTIPHTSDGTWERTIQLTADETRLLLKAYTSTHLNQKEVLFITGEGSQVVSTDMLIVAIGVVLIVCGLILVKKQETVRYW